MPRGRRAEDTSLLEAALIGFEQMRRNIVEKIAELQHRVGLKGGATEAGAAQRPRRRLSAATRKRIGAAQRKRWAAVKGKTKVVAPKRTMSKAARKKIAAAQRKRWAVVKAKTAKASS